MIAQCFCLRFCLLLYLKDLICCETFCIGNIIVFGLQAPLMAPSSQSEDLLDLEQVSLQEASLPPPIQRVMDPGWFTCSSSFVDVLFGFQLYTLLIVLLIFFSQVFQTPRWQ